MITIEVYGVNRLQARESLKLAGANAMAFRVHLL